MTQPVVLVTGGAGNVGRAVTRRFLERGARVAVPLYRTDAVTALDEVRALHGDRLHTFALDLTTERGAAQAVEQVVEWGGRIDVLVHLVGGYTGGTRLAETAVEALDRMIDLNLKSAWLVARFAIPAMIRNGGGSMIFVSSRAALEGRSGQAAYAVAKSALITLVEAIAEEYREEGIRANVVLPGTIDTEANRRAIPDADHTRWTRPDAIAGVIHYLASPESGPINGASVPVYGLS